MDFMDTDLEVKLEKIYKYVYLYTWLMEGQIHTICSFMDLEKCKKSWNERKMTKMTIPIFWNFGNVMKFNNLNGNFSLS